MSDNIQKTTTEVRVDTPSWEHRPVKGIAWRMVATTVILAGSLGMSICVSADSEKPVGERLMMNNNCFECHRGDVQVIGPSLDAIAQRYQPVNDVKIKTLVRKVIEGGYGNWGVVPMVPNAYLSPKDAEAMVRYILNGYGEKKKGGDANTRNGVKEEGASARAPS